MWPEAANALSAAGIEAVLTGGACATFYSKGEYQSSDLDFVLQSAVSQRQLDAAMETIDFVRRTNYYEHPKAPFSVEFPRGPLGIGADIEIRPVEHEIGNARVMLLSATDSCRDRLAAFYHWTDRQSLDTAVRIAQHHRVNLRAIGEWSSREAASAEFEEFMQALRSSRKSARAVGRRRPKRR